MIFQDRMTGYATDSVTVLIGGKFLSRQADTLKDSDVIADHARLADHRTRPVVYREMMTDLRARMDIDSGLRMCHLRNHTRNIRNPELIQLMGDPVITDRPETGITKYDLT